MAKVLVIYTGGTFGMEEAGSRALKTPRLSPPVLARKLRARVPELRSLAHCDVEIAFNEDSAHLGSRHWRSFAELIEARWRDYDGVVLLHGTDTMAYTASALSFLLRPCLKPVILTGAQRPLSVLRTDARRNLISAVEIAARGPRERVRQVCVFFDDRLFQGNRSRKRSAAEFQAFESPGYPPLAVVGTEIRYPDIARDRAKSKPRGGRLEPAFSTGVVLMHLTPGFPARSIREQLLPRLEGLVLVAFASGTAPTHDPEFIRLLDDARERGLPVVVATEDGGGRPEVYEAGRQLIARGVCWAGAMTPECAFVKTSWLLAQRGGARTFRANWTRDFAGEGTC